MSQLERYTDIPPMLDTRYPVYQYCSTCKRATDHARLDTTGFFTNVIIAMATRFKTDLREPTIQCNRCGEKK